MCKLLPPLCIAACLRLTGATVCAHRGDWHTGENEKAPILSCCTNAGATRTHTRARAPTHPHLNTNLSGCPDPEHQTQSAGQKIPISAMQMRWRSINMLLFQKVFSSLGTKKLTQPHSERHHTLSQTKDDSWELYI